LGRARYLDPAGFGARVALSAVATLLLLLAGHVHEHARLEVRGAPPWPAPASAQVPAGVHAAGLTLPVGQPDVVRFAVHLDVIVDGGRVTVPPGVGVDVRGRLTAALSTADSSGIIHVESDDDHSVFTLGQFFDEWQVALTLDQLGGLRASRHDPVTVYLDGSRLAGPPGSVTLKPHEEIAVTYRPGPVAVPAGYAFPAGT
jgi:hypothetical protein